MLPNTAVQRTAGIRRVFWAFSRLSLDSVSKLGSPQPPLTQAVNRHDMRYRSKSSEIAKFSRIFDDSSL
jgi:hypothetical protein